MDFDAKKKEMLKALSNRQKDKTMERRSAGAKARLHAKSKAGSSGSSLLPETKNKKEQKEFLVFGQPGLFLGTLKSVLQEHGKVTVFHNINKATEYLLTKHLPLVIMDMDHPNDWRHCHDLFTTGKTMYPDIEYIIYQMSKSPSEPVQILAKQGAHVLNKPVDATKLADVVRALIYNKRT